MHLRDARPGDAPAIARIHLEARRLAMPEITLAHTDEEVHRWVAAKLVPSGKVRVAVDREDAVIAYAASGDGWLEQLYVDPAHQGRGAGTALLGDARRRCPGGLQLWVFQVNQRARRFYARHGAVQVRFTDGADNEERAPDVLLHLPSNLPGIP
jgi:GNAT superfamily N-acetyltransferase